MALGTLRATLHTMKAFSLCAPITMAPIGHTSGMAARLPDFLGLGAQKGGTTTLHRLLGSAVWVALVLLNWGVSFFVV